MYFFRRLFLKATTAQQLLRWLYGRLYFLLHLTGHRNFFRQLVLPEQRLKFAKRNLRFVEIEIFSFCNRKCWFCPNAQLDRRSKNILLPEEIYLDVLKQLQAIDYKGYIAYAGYNEPLADKIFLTRLKQARQYLPEAILYAHSNSDYATPEYLEEMSAAGLNALALQCYLDKDEPFTLDTILPKAQRIADRLRLEYKYSADKNNADHYEFYLWHPKLNLVLQAWNFTNVGNARGGMLKNIKQYQRTAPCYAPFFRCYIEYDGSVKTCCHVRHDNPKHQPMIMGNLQNQSLLEIFCNERFAALRKALYRSGPKKYPCDTCNGFICRNVYEYTPPPYIFKYLARKLKVIM